MLGKPAVSQLGRGIDGGGGGEAARYKGPYVTSEHKRHVLTWESFQEATLIKRIFCRFIIVATIASPRVCMVACLVATQSSVPAASVSSSPNSYATAAPYRSSLFSHDVPHRCPRCHALRRVRRARARSLRADARTRSCMLFDGV